MTAIFVALAQNYDFILRPGLRPFQLCSIFWNNFVVICSKHQDHIFINGITKKYYNLPPYPFTLFSTYFAISPKKMCNRNLKNSFWMVISKDLLIYSIHWPDSVTFESKSGHPSGHTRAILRTFIERFCIIFSPQTFHHFFL